MSTAQNKDPWKTGHASDSASSESEDDQAPSGYRRAALNADRRLAADLDFSKRYETVKFTPTPFNLAQINAARSAPRSNLTSSTVRQASQKQAPPSSSTAVHLSTQNASSAWKVVSGKVDVNSSSSEPRRQTGRSIPIANPDPGGRNDVRLLEQQKTEEKRERAKQKQEEKAKKKDWTKYSGWTERGQPVPITKVRRSLTEVTDEQEAAAARAKKRRVITKTVKTAGNEGEGAEGEPQPVTKAPPKKKRAAPKAAASKRKGQKKEVEEKVTFGRIPADAGPSDRFPILQGLDKQRDLPVKPRAKKTSAARPKLTFTSVKSDSESDERVDLDHLFEGIARDANRQSTESGADSGRALRRTDAAADPRDGEETAEEIAMSSTNAQHELDPENTAASLAPVSSPIDAAGAAVDVEIASDIGDFNSSEDAADQTGHISDEANPQSKNLAELRANLMRENAALDRKRSVERKIRLPTSAKSRGGRLFAESPREDEEPRYRAPMARKGYAVTQSAHGRLEPPSGHGTPAGDAMVPIGYEGTVLQSAGMYDSNLWPRAQRPAYGYDGENAPIPSDALVPPSTITHVSLPQTSKYFGPRSSSSQLPYSSPLEQHTRNMRDNPHIATPAPHRLPAYGLEAVNYLEDMAQASHEHQAEGYMMHGMRVSDDEMPLAGHGIGPVQHLEHMAKSYDSDFDYWQSTVRNPQDDLYVPDATHYRQPFPVRPHLLSSSGDLAPSDTSGRLNSYAYAPAMRKPDRSSQSPPLPKIKAIKRTRAERPPLHGAGNGRRSTDNEWSTLEPNSKKKRPSPDFTQTPNFRLPAHSFTLSQTRQTGLSNGKSSASSASARAGWFKPSDPGAPTKARNINNDYSTVTSRGVHQGRQKDQESKSRPTFVTRARREEEPADAQERFHDQLRAAVGIQGQTRTAMRDLRGSRATGSHEVAEAEGDWRDAWRNGGRGVGSKATVPEAQSALQSKFTYAGPKQSRVAPVTDGRAFEI